MNKLRQKLNEPSGWRHWHVLHSFDIIPDWRWRILNFQWSQKHTALYCIHSSFTKKWYMYHICIYAMQLINVKLAINFDVSIHYVKSNLSKSGSRIMMITGQNIFLSIALWLDATAPSDNPTNISNCHFIQININLSLGFFHDKARSGSLNVQAEWDGLKILRMILESNEIRQQQPAWSSLWSCSRILWKTVDHHPNIPQTIDLHLEVSCPFLQNLKSIMSLEMQLHL